MATQNENGVWDFDSLGEEAAHYELQELQAVIPDWQQRLNEHDSIEAGNIVTLSDVEFTDYEPWSPNWEIHEMELNGGW